MSLTNEVVQLIGKPEGSTLEYHPILVSPEKIAQTISAFASADGGFILLGVTKKGKVNGLSKGFRVEDIMADVPQFLEPTPKIISEFIDINGKNVYAIKVLKSSTEILVKGQRFVREGSKTVLKTAPQTFNLPPEFVQKLKVQVAEQYQYILRYRELKNNASDTTQRQKHQEEIDRRQQNIEEIVEGFLQDAKMKESILPDEALKQASQQIVTNAKEEIEQSQTSPSSNNKPVIFTAFAKYPYV